MSWSRSKAVAALLAVFGLSACGFEPLHGKKDGYWSVPEMAAIKVAAIEDRHGQHLRNELLDRLTPTGQPARSQYLLRVTSQESTTSLGIRKDATASRSNLVANASYTLEEGGRIITQGSASSSVSYDVLDAKFATTVAELNASKRAAQELADAITAHIASFFTCRRQPGCTQR
jgi:LPS-assembly lipoprotein